MRLFRREEESKDKVILVLDEKIQIIDVIKEDAQGVYTVGQVFPRQDLVQKFNPNGGVYYLADVSLQYLEAVEHVKMVEQNIAIKNIFDYGHIDKRSNLSNYFQWAIIILLIFGLMFK